MRKQGEGTYYRDGKSYCWAVRAGSKRIVRKASTHSELKHKVLTVQREMSAGRTATGRLPSITVYLATYIDTLVVRPSTLRGYTRAMKLLDEVIGSVPLDKLTALAVEKASKSIGENHGTRDAQLAHSFLRTALRIAQRDGLIASNPAALARVPRHTPKPKRYLPQDEVGVFLEALPETHQGLALRFILYTGLRTSEALNVTLFDISEEGLRVRKSKTRAGEWRLVPLHPKAREAVAKMMELRAGFAEHQPWIDSGMLFCTSVGTPIEPTNLRPTMMRALQASGVRYVSPHDLRRTFATMLARTSIGRRSMASVMGWSKMETVEEIYVMADEAAKAAAVEEIKFN